jgi:zinc and cadmium transporter
MSDLLAIILLALLGGVIALSGGVVFLLVKPWSKVLSRYSVPFAAGVLLTVALVGLLPESVHEIGEAAYLWVLLAFLGSYLFEIMLFELHHHDSDHGGKSLSGSIWLVIVGDTVHNLIDGVAIAASYFVNPGLGLVTTVSTFLHEVPHEIGDFGILLKAGWRRRNILMVNILSALFTVVGALGVYYWGQGEGVVGYLLAIAVGLFLYLGASDFLPQAVKGMAKGRAVVALFLGVALMVATFMAVPHSDGVEEEMYEPVENEQNLVIDEHAGGEI